MPEQPLPRVAQEIKAITALLATTNIAIPVIVGTLTSVVAIVQALRGTAPPLADILADLEQQIAANRARGRAELERLQALAQAEGRR